MSRCSTVENNYLVMKRLISILSATLVLVAVAPGSAQETPPLVLAPAAPPVEAGNPPLSPEASFFYGQLAPYGQWFWIAPHAWVWAPNNVSVDGTTKALRRIRMASSSPNSGSAKTILVADDDAVLRESLAAVLRAEEFAVRLAENGRVAVREFLNGPPDLILLDLNMPDTDGWRAFEVMARLAPDVPVVVITARPDQARRAAEAGIDMLLEKPLDIPTLLEAMPEHSRFARILRAWHTSDLPGTQE
jgi:CheY-like chemotaxis protein